MNKKIIIGIAGFALLLGAIGQIGNNKTNVAGVATTVAVTPTLIPTATLTPTQAPTPTSTPSPTTYVAPTASQTYQQSQTQLNSSTSLSNDNYYTNSEDNEVHSPAYSNSVPAGATAQCSDGTYSFSQNHRGTCSHHGGVSQWY